MALIVAMSTHAEVKANGCDRRDYATRFGLANRRDALNCGVALRSTQFSELHASNFVAVFMQDGRFE
jgi:hypothetical protein